MIDTHAHVFKELYEDYDEIVKQSVESLDYLINVSWDVKTSNESIELSKKYKNVYSTIGIHPNDAIMHCSDDVDNLENLMTEKVVAIGEIGLDYSKEGFDKKVQEFFFIKQIELANKLNLPVVVHTRDAMQDTLSIISTFPDTVFLMHSWSGSTKDTDVLLERKNIYFSYNGISTFKNAPEIRETMSMIPLDRIVFETDCPWLTPVPFRGKKNKPEYVKYVLQNASEFLNIDIKELEEISDANARKVFGL